MNLKPYLPYLSAIIIFIVITMAYFQPLMEGKKLYQGDITNHIGMSHEIVKYRETHDGKEPLWTNSMFGGMPAYQISTVYHKNLVAHFDKLFLFLPHPSGLLFLYLIGFYILLLSLRVDPWLSIVGSIAFAFSSYFFIILEAGHNSKAQAIGYMAPVVAGIILTFRGKLILGACVTALFLSLQLHSNHLQITYYLMLTLLLFGIAQLVNAIREKQIHSFLKASGILIVSAILAIIPNITNLWVTYEYGQYSTRGKSELTTNKENKTSGLDRDYATDWSYGIDETMTLMIPDFKGGASEAIASYDEDALKNVDRQFKDYVGKGVAAYWGEQPFTSGPVYVGAVVCLLFVLGLFIVKGVYKWWLLAATLLSIFLAWGYHFMGFTNFFFNYIPGYNKFRAVSMTLVIAEFCIPLLAILSLDHIIKNFESIKANVKLATKEINFKQISLIALITTAGTCLICLLFAGSFDYFGTNRYGEYEYDKIHTQLLKQGASEDIAAQILNNVELARKAIFTSDVTRSFIFILLATALLYVFAFVKQNRTILITAIGVLILVDLWSVDKRYLNESNFEKSKKVEKPFTPSAADQQILADKEPNFRVLNVAVNTFNDASTSYFHKSIGGYHGAKLKRYQELIEHHLSSKRNMNVINMLNTKYFIIPDKNSGQARALPNPERLGAAWFIDTLKWVANADSEITALSNFNPKTTVVIDQRYGDDFITSNTSSSTTLNSFSPSTDSSRTITLETYEPNHLTYKSHSNADQLAVFSEIFYDKGWNAYIDGKEHPHFRVNYVLRGMVVPVGDHTIEFTFEPKSYYTGEKISLAGSILLLLLVIGGVMFEASSMLKK